MALYSLLQFASGYLHDLQDQWFSIGASKTRSNLEKQPYTPNNAHHEVRRLFRDLLGTCGGEHEMGQMSCTIYDTAWVAMIVKDTPQGPTWLFPQSFRYLLERQLETGGWERYSCQIDELLNTAAGLLCLLKHRNHPHCQPSLNPLDLEARIAKATAFLRSKLCEWDVSKTDHAAFEILIPALLEYLETEGLQFKFAGRAALFQVRETKLKKLDLRWLYDTPDLAPTILYSLEGLIGIVNFDRLAHRKVGGSMMLSPSSTAAALMHTAKWDLESEAYLRRAFAHGAGNGKGGFASAYPSTYYEISWVSSTDSNPEPAIRHFSFAKQDAPGLFNAAGSWV